MTPLQRAQMNGIIADTGDWIDDEDRVHEHHTDLHDGLRGWHHHHTTGGWLFHDAAAEQELSDASDFFGVDFPLTAFFDAHRADHEEGPNVGPPCTDQECAGEFLRLQAKGSDDE